MTAPLRVLVGPTASGKTELSLLLAEALKGEIISVDSRQIYRGLEIGSAAPDAAELARVPHHLVGEVEPETVMNAGEYGRMARERIEGIRARGVEPILVGGSGLYLRAVLGGLDETLPRDLELREVLRARVRAEGSESLHAELARLDPASAASISPRDGQRVTRALEIAAVTGELPSRLRRRGRATSLPARVVVLDRPRAELETRIRTRVDAMITAGLEAEARRLLDRGLRPELPVLRSVGYAETFRYLRGELDAEAWREEIVVNTRRYAKRQRTWFRSLGDATWLEASRDTPLADLVPPAREAWTATPGES